MNQTHLLDEPSFPIEPTVGNPLITLAALLLGLSVFLSKRVYSSTDDGSCKPPRLLEFLPLLGSTIEMGMDIVGFIRKYCQQFGTPIFSATILGNRSYFLGDADLVLMAYSHPSLDFSPLHIDFCSRVGGIKRKDLLAMYNNPKLLKGMRASFTKHILGREALEGAVEDAQHTLSNFIDKELSHEGWAEVDLMEFCHTAVVLASTGPFVSRDIAKKDALPLLKDFDAGVSLVMAGVPVFLLPSFRRARDEIIKRLGSATNESPLSTSLRQMAKEAGFGEDFNVRKMLILFWAVNANSAPAVFWALARLLLDNEAHNAVRKQVDEHRTSGFKSLAEIEQLTVLRSVFWETLRLSWGGFTPRIVKKDFDLNQWGLRQGGRVMTYAQVVHRDPEIFHSPDDFVFDRFIPDADGNDPEFRTKRGKKIGLSSFGGGAHLCPGRKFIMYEFQAFVAMLFEKYEMRVAPGQQLPSVDLAKEGVGVSQPATAFRVQIRRRPVVDAVSSEE